MNDTRGIVIFLFTDIAGSTRLWEQQPGRMEAALARHDALAQAAIAQHRGILVKSTGDGILAVFDDPADAVAAALQLQFGLADPDATGGIALEVRCGMHAGPGERRDDDFFGPSVNRAARIMSAAHGGQILLSQTVALLVADRLPADVHLRELGAVRLRDLAQPEQLFQVVHPDLRQDFPALAALEETPNNLSQQLTSFIGREREIDEVEALLARSRLLTIHGAGGLGKTRLAQVVAGKVMNRFPDGAWFVDLAPVTDATLVPQRVASVLGLREAPGRPLQDSLLKYARERRFLLILDNCEHLAQACAELANALLQASRHASILATSREPLHVTGEITFPLAAFAVPAADATILPAALLRLEAVRLFVDRARRARPDFSVTAANAAAIAEICRRVDGIPLALELAAARVPTMSVDRIAERLRDRFGLLVGDDRTVLPRQRTLRALIDWSHDLLEDGERAVFRRLAVFAGGFTLDGAETVGAGGTLAPTDILDLLHHLVEKSLVAVEAGGERYRMLETIREYARERLADSPDGEQARLRHLHFHIDLVERARPFLVGPDHGIWLARLDLERENILTAHTFAGSGPVSSDDGLRLVAPTKVYWFQRGLLVLGHRIIMEALAREPEAAPSLPRGHALFGAGGLCYFMGRYDAARDLLARALETARSLDNDAMAAAVLQPLGMACLGLGDLAAARGYLDKALEFARRIGKEQAIAAALNHLAQLHRVEGELVAAEALYSEVVALAQRLEDGDILAIAQLNLAMTAIQRTANEDAREILLKVLTLADETGSTPAAQSVVEVAAGLAAARGEWRRAARLFGVAQARAAATGMRRDPADEAFLAPLVDRARVALGAETFDAEAMTGNQSDEPYALTEIRGWLGAA